MTFQPGPGPTQPAEPAQPAESAQPADPAHTGLPAQPAEHAQQALPAQPERRTVTVRRAPRFVPFLVVGVLAGVLAAAIVALSGPGSVQYARSTVFGFFAVLLAIPGAALGGAVALILDRTSVRRSDRAVVEETDAPDVR
ncbi:MAG: hypothetical protein ACHP7K_00595 [Actinomycetales bacterium]